MPDDDRDLEREKRALRMEFRERRRNRTATQRAADSEQLTEHLIRVATEHGARSIATFLSTAEEPDTRPFLRWTQEQGIRVLLPISRSDGLLDWAPYDGNGEAEDVQGMPTPTTDVLSPIAINDVDLILVPAAAVDRTGMRMGWGRGYFDKTLGSMENAPPVYAVIFDDEFVESLPRERHDVPVGGVVRPAGVTTF